MAEGFRRKSERPPRSGAAGPRRDPADPSRAQGVIQQGMKLAVPLHDDCQTPRFVAVATHAEPRIHPGVDQAAGWSSCRGTYARLRTFQISSTGHWRAHSSGAHA